MCHSIIAGRGVVAHSRVERFQVLAVSRQNLSRLSVSAEGLFERAAVEYQPTPRGPRDAQADAKVDTQADGLAHWEFVRALEAIGVSVCRWFCSACLRPS
jgi:hypothetical protein